MNDTHLITAIVLAAGLSRRMGRAKLLLPLQGGPVIRITVERVLASGIARAVVVTGPEPLGITEALVGLPVTLAENPLSCVVLGTGKMLSDFDLLREIAIN